jgi:hypothetical protein
MKKLLLVVCILASGCASRPTKVAYDDIRSVTANCAAAKTQIEYLTTQLKLYQDAHPADVQSEEDRKYIAKAKNVIWSLRSSCPANYM